jgi:hypothetical protein
MLHKGRFANHLPKHLFDNFNRPRSVMASLLEAFYQEYVHGETLTWLFLHSFSNGISLEGSMWMFMIRRNILQPCGGGRSRDTRASAQMLPTFQVCVVTDLGREGAKDGMYGCIHIHGNRGQRESDAEYSESSHVQHTSRIPCSHYADPVWFDFTLLGRLIDGSGDILSQDDSWSWNIYFAHHEVP